MVAKVEGGTKRRSLLVISLDQIVSKDLTAHFISENKFNNFGIIMLH